MANVANINGYDVKDVAARNGIADIQQDLSTAQGDITTLQGDVSNTKADLGDITALDTTVKTDLVSAINEVKGKADDNASAIGTLSSLDTTVKTDLVSAIDEVKGKADDNASAIGTLSALDTTVKTDLVSAINEVGSHAGTNTSNFAPAFSEVTSYAVGDYVTYNNILYRCTTVHTAGVWVAGHFTQSTVGESIDYTTINLPNGIDLNDYYDRTALYYISDASSVSNLPSTGSSQYIFLRVESNGASCKQTVWLASDETLKHWERIRGGYIWSSWKVFN